jgi:hypothetical protein
MNRFVLSLGLVLLLTSVFCVYAVTDEGTSRASPSVQSSGSDMSDSGTCPGCPQNGATAKSTKNRDDMMRKMGMSEETIKQWHALSKAPIFLNSPAALLGQADALNLTQDQRQKLTQIDKEARDKAMQILSADQKSKLAQPTDRPVTMMQMHQTMCGKAMQHHKMKEGGKDAGTRMCPMCPMCPMSQDKSKMKTSDSGTQTTQPAADQAVNP